MKTARLDWQDGVPKNLDYGDIYCQGSAGLAEKRHVFIDGNDLPHRFSLAKRFAIGELGFGLGVAFLATMQLWKQVAPEDAWLDYYCVEHLPLTKPDLERALRQWPELAEEALLLLKQYPPAVPGCHPIYFPDHRVRLVLMLGDALEMFRQLPARVNAWFLDGFSPKANPEMWQRKLFSVVAEHSATGATAATYSAAGEVRRALQDNGFEVEKIRGFSNKREMIRAKIEYGSSQKEVSPSSVLIIGAGLAGCSVAYHLALRGIRVKLVDKGAHVASGASGTPAAILYPHLSFGWDVLTRFSLPAYLYALRLLDHAGFKRGGMVRLPKNDKEKGRLCEIPSKLDLLHEVVRAVTPEEASALSGIPCTEGGLFFPGSGTVDVRKFCEFLIQNPLIDFHPLTEILSLEEAKDYDTVVLANAHDAERLAGVDLKLGKVRGQVSRVEGEVSLLRPLCYGGYLTPDKTLGATFEREYISTEIRDASHLENILKLQSNVPYFSAKELRAVNGWAGVRATTRDRFPIVKYVRDNLYVITGFGARGLAHAPYCGDVLASALCTDSNGGTLVR